MDLICRACGKKVEIYDIVGGELMTVTTIMSHIITCPESKKNAEKQGESLKEVLKIFFDFNDNKEIKNG